jgi:prophage regulatory protein
MTTRNPERGLLRLNQIVGGPNPLLPVSRSTWWAGIKSGRFPQPVALGPKIRAWRAEDIQKIIDHGIELSKDGKR